MENTVLEFETLFYNDTELLTELHKFIRSTYEEEEELVSLTKFQF